MGRAISSGAINNAGACSQCVQSMMTVHHRKTDAMSQPELYNFIMT